MPARQASTGLAERPGRILDNFGADMLRPAGGVLILHPIPGAKGVAITDTL